MDGSKIHLSPALHSLLLTILQGEIRDLICWRPSSRRLQVFQLYYHLFAAIDQIASRSFSGLVTNLCVVLVKFLLLREYWVFRNKFV